MEIFDQDQRTFFVEVLLPVPIPRSFTYRVPFNLANSVQVGQRTIVQFGDRKILTGLILQVHENPPKDYEAKYLLEILDETPLVNYMQLKLFEWIASYYACTTGEVMNAAFPAGLKLSSESMVQLNPSFNADESEYPFPTRNGY